MGGVRQWAGSRGQSGPLGLALVFAVMIVTTTAVVAIGADSIASTRSQLDLERTEKSMTELDSQASLVALGQSNVRQIDLVAADSNRYRVREDVGNVTVTSSGPSGTIVETDLGAVVYEGEDGETVAYQGGGVWRSNGNGRTTMVSPPEFHYRNRTLTLSLVTVQGERKLGDRAIVTHNNSTRHWPNASAGRANPLDNGSVNVTVRSEYYRGWGEYFETRTDGTVEYNHSGNEVTLKLLVPATNPAVQGGIVAANPNTDLTIKNNAEADSYNSSQDSYSGSSNSNTKIVAGGDVDIEENAIINGTLESGGDVTIDNNGEIRGNLSYGGSASGSGYPGGVSGWSAQNASITPADSVERLIDKRRASISSSNDNAATADVDESTNTLQNCASTCELTAGNYYLSAITLHNSDSDNLRIDTSGGDVNIVVDGAITIQNGQEIEVVGGNRVNVYTEGNFYQNNKANVSVAGDRAPNFWVYTNPDADVEFDQNAEFTGVLYGPNGPSNDGADISVGQNAQVYGGLIGDVTFVSNNYGVHYDEALKQTETTTIPQAVPPVTYIHVSTNQVNVTAG